MLVQTWAQAHMSAAHAAVVMVLEPVWAAYFGIALWDESLDRRIVVGGALVLVAMLLVVTRPGGRQVAAGAADRRRHRNGSAGGVGRTAMT